MAPVVGLVGELERVVTSDVTAKHIGSGTIEVLGTPMLILWMEEAGLAATDGHLADGQTTVGASVQVRHVAPTPVGQRVRVRAELVQVDGRRLVFNVSAADETELVGEGTHERYIIDVARFAARLQDKR